MKNKKFLSNIIFFRNSLTVMNDFMISIFELYAFFSSSLLLARMTWLAFYIFHEPYLQI